MKKTSVAERLMGSGITIGAATYLAATAPYAPIAVMFLPLLLDSFAQGRCQARIEKAINELQLDLAEDRAKIENLTDAQFKFVNETISTFLQTMDEEKLSYLKCVIRACVNDPDMTHKEASIMSRIIRDISVDEIRLLASNSDAGGLVVSGDSEDETANGARRNRAVLQDTSDNRMLMSGLISLGLLELDDNVFGNAYAFTPTVWKLLALVGDASAEEARGKS
jgi:hypothetical protein